MKCSDSERSFFRHRCRSRWRLGPRFANVLRTEPRVILGRRQTLGDLAAGDGLIEQLLQKRPAPAAAGPRAEAFTELRSPLGLLDANKVDHLALGDVKAEAELVVQFHPGIVREDS